MREHEPGDDERLLDHRYDDIQEYDNPLPRWWVWIFWATILYAVLYVLDVPGIADGRRVANYEREMAAAQARFAGRDSALQITDEALRALVGSPAEVAEGRAQFVESCSPCHREDGGGLIGPNLTDAYWIHGGHPIEIYRTVHGGVPDKGMPAWSQVLDADHLSAVVAYVITLRTTHPAEPKEPQGLNADSVSALAVPAAVTPVTVGPRATSGR